MRRAAMLAGALALAGCAAHADSQRGRQASADRDLAEALAGRVAGAPVDCVSMSGLSGPQVIDRDRIVYRGAGRVWLSVLGGSCPGLDQDDLLVSEVHGSQLCRGDLFRANDRGSPIPGPYCRFGKFTPYTKAKN